MTIDENAISKIIYNSASDKINFKGYTMAKLLKISGISLLITMTLLILFFVNIKSITISTSPATELSAEEIAAKFKNINFKVSNKFNYALTTTPQINTYRLDRDTIPGKIKLRIDSIAIDSSSGTQLINLKIGQKTSLFDLTVPTKYSYIQLAINQPIKSTLTIATITKIIIIISFTIVFLIILISILAKYLTFSPKIQIPLDKSKNYSLRSLIGYCLIVFIFSRLIFLGEYWFLSTHSSYTGSFFANMCHADCGFYQSIYHSGYTQNVIGNTQANWAFFPLFPLLIKGLLWLHFSELSGIILNQVLLFGSLVILFIYTQNSFNIKAAKLATLFLAAGSENIYFMTVYTEAVFLFLSLLSIYLLSKNRFFIASVTAGLLSAARFIGLIMAVIIVMKGLKKQLHYKWIFYGVLALSGLLGFMFYLHIHVNDALAFYHVQNAWRHTDDLSWFMNPFWSAYMTIVRGNGMDRLLFILSLPIVWWLIKNGKKEEALFLGFLMLATFASKSLQSYTRFFFDCYPVYIYLGVYGATSYGRALAVGLILMYMHSLYLLFWLQQSGSAW